VGSVWEKLKSIARVLVLSSISSSLYSVNLRASKVLVIPGEFLFRCCFALSVCGCHNSRCEIRLSKSGSP
jgi:hypothetical protein